MKSGLLFSAMSSAFLPLLAIILLLFPRQATLVQFRSKYPLSQLYPVSNVGLDNIQGTIAAFTDFNGDKYRPTSSALLEHALQIRRETGRNHIRRSLDARDEDSDAGRLAEKGSSDSGVLEPQVEGLQQGHITKEYEGWNWVNVKIAR
ncbi:hypothetical protein BC936DRAFT_148237 [Jimgerdemannia flammicorona]|uniref:Uncharacterized protein n=1 Tax=Jimgerdemannia flammicorona TaxID=994334 RepID=A0A433D3J5_9FUNG|nr:hypothetical protein BC936DRAFT_148237 [Jimgerdemannia flammicorona]